MVSLRCRKLSPEETLAMITNSVWCARGAGARLIGWHQRSDPRLLQRNDPFGINLTLWPMFTVYLEDGRVEIDNNPVENAIRPTAVGKKNWLFIGEAEVGQRSIILFTIIEHCRSRGIDPQGYLREVLTRLPTLTTSQIKHITPEAWAKAQKADPQRKAA
jgi:hypothetical protein